jgi:hypothetical protein
MANKTHIFLLPLLFFCLACQSDKPKDESDLEASDTEYLGKDTATISIEALLKDSTIEKDKCKAEFKAHVKSELQKDSIAFQHTWIATDEFKARLAYMYLSCRGFYNVFDIYLRNIDKTLWEADELAAEFLEKTNNPQAENFRKFAKMKNNGIVNTSPLSQKLVSEVKQRRALINKQSFLHYPSNESLTRDGWVNVYGYCAPFITQIDHDESILGSVVIKCKLLKEAISNNDFDIILISKELSGRSIYLNKKNDDYFLKIRGLPKNKKLLLIARSKGAKKLAFIEIMPKEGENNCEILVNAKDENELTEKKINEYMLAHHIYALSTVKDGSCCGY